MHLRYIYAFFFIKYSGYKYSKLGNQKKTLSRLTIIKHAWLVLEAHHMFITNHINDISLDILIRKTTKIVSEYDQEIPQSQTAYKPMAPRGRATQRSQDTRKTN